MGNGRIEIFPRVPGERFISTVIRVLSFPRAPLRVHVEGNIPPHLPWGTRGNVWNPAARLLSGVTRLFSFSPYFFFLFETPQRDLSTDTLFIFLSTVIRVFSFPRATFEAHVEGIYTEGHPWKDRPAFPRVPGAQKARTTISTGALRAENISTYDCLRTWENISTVAPRLLSTVNHFHGGPEGGDPSETIST